MTLNSFEALSNSIKQWELKTVIYNDLNIYFNYLKFLENKYLCYDFVN